jgi:hypothetical protein
MPSSSSDDDDFAAVLLLLSSSCIPLNTILQLLPKQNYVIFLLLWSFNAGIITFLAVPWWILGNHLFKGCTTPAMIRPLLPLLALMLYLFRSSEKFFYI